MRHAASVRMARTRVRTPPESDVTRRSEGRSFPCWSGSGGTRWDGPWSLQVKPAVDIDLEVTDMAESR